MILPSLDSEEYAECQKVWQTHLMQFQCVPVFSFLIAIDLTVPKMVRCLLADSELIYGLAKGLT